jgi:hypothetical protein
MIACQQQNIEHKKINERYEYEDSDNRSDSR